MWEPLVVTRVMKTLQRSKFGMDPLTPSTLLRHCGLCTILLYEHVFWILSNFYCVLLMALWCALVFSISILDNCKE